MDENADKNSYSHKELLGYFSKYSNKKSVWDYDFVYKNSMNDINLLKLHEAYNLDLKAGRMDSFNRQLRIMRWTHEVMLNKETDRYNGNLTALDILDSAFNEKKSYNCIEHAIVLAQCLLSMGYCARYVSCLPLDALPFDNHVLTEVYSDIHGKWIILDSTISAYFTDSENEVLSLVDLRDSLVNGKKILFNYFDRFSGSGVPKSSFAVNYREEGFINTLVRNLFVLQYKQINDSSSNEEVYYRLIPLNYMHSNIEKTLFDNRKKIVYRYTDNAAFVYTNPYVRGKGNYVQAFNV